MQRQLFRFERLIIKMIEGVGVNIKYFPQVMGLYIKYLSQLEDDFSKLRERALEGMVEFIERTSPHFYLVLSGDEVCGFFCLEHLIGSDNELHTAEVVTGFYPKYWGIFTKYAGLEFRRYCFDVLKLQKIKALVYPQNSKVKAILRACGFEKEALLKNETRRNGVTQDIEVYSLFNKKEEKCN